LFIDVFLIEAVLSILAMIGIGWRFECFARQVLLFFYKIVDAEMTF
jgi:hypothetical protein